MPESGVRLPLHGGLDLVDRVDARRRRTEAQDWAGDDAEEEKRPSPTHERPFHDPSIQQELPYELDRRERVTLLKRACINIGYHQE